MTIGGTESSGRVVVEIADDGVGGLADRVEALGGRLRVDSPAGAGTRIFAELSPR